MLGISHFKFFSSEEANQMTFYVQVSWIIYNGALFVGPITELSKWKPRQDLWLTSSFVPGLSHLLVPNLYLAKREGNSNKNEFLQKLQLQNHNLLEFINTHILKMNPPYWVLFLAVNQIASLDVENNVEYKKHFNCTNLIFILKSWISIRTGSTFKRSLLRTYTQ